jgi:hypothetical protein
MKKRLPQIVFVFAIFLSTSNALMAQFTISGEFRPRAEFRDGYQKLGDSTMKAYPDILGRSRISFDYKSEKVATCFSLQHAFTFGENNYASDTISKNTVNIFEGWLRYNFTSYLSMRAGRVVLSYDDQRILGASNWNQWGSTHDVANLMWEIPGHNYSGDFGIAINNMAPASSFLSSYNLKNYKYMSYLWEQKKFFNDRLKISLIGIIDANQKPSTLSTKTTSETLWVTSGTDTIGSTVIKTTSKITELYPNTLYARGTVGLNVWYSWKHLSLFASGYYQGGHFKDGRKLSAWFAGGYAAYQIVKPFKLLLGYEHLSGTDFSNPVEVQNKVHGFSTLWGTNHRFYGYMDMFRIYLAQDALEEGLNDFYGRGTLSFSDKTSLEATYRWFTLPQGYLPHIPTSADRSTFQRVDTNLGSELDVMFLYQPIANLELNAAYCLYFKTTTREILDNLAPGTGRLGQYAYVMITYKPNFYSSEKK